MRRISVPALFTSLAIVAFACTPFHGDEASSGATDASTEGAASPSQADGSIASADAGASSKCTPLLAEHFDMVLPTSSPWMPADKQGMASSLDFDGTNGAAAAGSLKAHVDLAKDTSPHAFLRATQTLIQSSPPHFRLEFSMMLGASFTQKDFIAEIGCTLDIGGLTFLFTHEGGGSYNAALENGAGTGAGNTTLTATMPTQKWIDLRVDVNGVGGGASAVTTAIWLHEAGIGTAKADSFVTTMAVPLSGNLGMNCGINHADTTSSTPPYLDLWVDDVTLSACE